MIVCKRCGKENQDHYKFCLGCGAELREAAAAAAAPARTDAQGVGVMKTVMADQKHAPMQASASHSGSSGPRSTNGGGAASRGPARASSAGMGAGMVAPQPMPMGPPPGVSAPMPPFAAPAPAAEKLCTQCGTTVPANFRFCGVCGLDLSGIAAPIARPNPATPEPARDAKPAAVLTLIRPDGSEGGTHPLEMGENKLGRNHGSIFENDGYLSPEHAILTITKTGTTIRDSGSLNGVFVRMVAEEEITQGQVIRIGQELLRFEWIESPAPLEDGTEVMGSPNPGYWGKITVIIGKDTDGSAYPLMGESVTLGRERGDINFPDDGYVSGLHARLTNRNGRIYLVDVGSSNGTFLRVKEERSLEDSSFVLLGQQLFRLKLN
jgi:hypothetical protein